MYDPQIRMGLRGQLVRVAKNSFRVLAQTDGVQQFSMRYRPRRYVLGVPAFTKRKPRSRPMVWTPAKDRLLGTMSDGDVARRLRCTTPAVVYRRRQLKIPPYGG